MTLELIFHVTVTNAPTLTVLQRNVIIIIKTCVAQ